MNDAIFQIVTDKKFDEVVNLVQEKTQANGFRVLYIHDVQATLAEKNFDREPLKIIEVCNAKYAQTALKLDITVSLLMPCRINVYTVEGKTVISTVQPKFLVKMFDKPELEEFATGVETVLLKIINESK